MNTWINQLWKSFLDLFSETKCPLCERTATEVLCPYCEKRLQHCQLANKQQFWHSELPLFAWGSYSSELKQAIAKLKYNEQTQLAQPLGRWIGEAWLKTQQGKQFQKNLAVLPIPAHPKKLQERGFNQAELLARSFCQFTGLPLNTKLLTRVKETQAMFNLNPQDRQKNIIGAFQVNQNAGLKKPPVSILLLDDIFTTGATAKEAAATLMRSNIEVKGIVALATTKKK